jgi:hypothetical protein
MSLECLPVEHPPVIRSTIVHNPMHTPAPRRDAEGESRFVPASLFIPFLIDTALNTVFLYNYRKKYQPL